MSRYASGKVFMLTAAAVATTGCGVLPHMGIRAVRNDPVPAVQVTSGDFRVGGAVQAHLVDQGGVCGGGQTVLFANGTRRNDGFVALLPSDDGETVTGVKVILVPFQGATRYGRGRAFVQLSFGIDASQLQSGIQGPTGRLFFSDADASVVMTSAFSGTVHATLREVHFNKNGSPGPTPPATSTPAATAVINGTFQCVDRGT